MTAAAYRYSFRSSRLFLWDMVEGRVRVIPPFVSDAPIPADADGTEAKKREKLLYHIQSGDYFGMLATALGFVEEVLRPSVHHAGRNTTLSSDEALLVHDLRNDLRYLHDNYDIRPKEKSIRKASNA